MKTIRNLSLIIVMASFGCATASAAISHQQIDQNTFEITLTKNKNLDIAQAQKEIYPKAKALCDGERPAYGKFKFNSTETVSGDEATDGYTFTQTITCTNEPIVALSTEKIDLSDQQEQSLKLKATELTENYMLAKEAQNYSQAYEFLGEGIKTIKTFSDWQIVQTTDFEQTGALNNRNLWKTDLHNNPPKAPEPGVYIAVAYENNYEKLAARCGYVVWQTKTGDPSELAIVHEDYSSIPTDFVEQTTPEALQQIRKQFRCPS